VVAAATIKLGLHACIVSAGDKYGFIDYTNSIKIFNRPIPD